MTCDHCSEFSISLRINGARQDIFRELLGRKLIARKGAVSMNNTDAMRVAVSVTSNQRRTAHQRMTCVDAGRAIGRSNLLRDRKLQVIEFLSLKNCRGCLQSAAIGKYRVQQSGGLKSGEWSVDKDEWETDLDERGPGEIDFLNSVSHALRRLRARVSGALVDPTSA